MTKLISRKIKVSENIDISTLCPVARFSHVFTQIFREIRAHLSIDFTNFSVNFTWLCPIISWLFGFETEFLNLNNQSLCSSPRFDPTQIEDSNLRFEMLMTVIPVLKIWVKRSFFFRNITGFLIGRDLPKKFQLFQDFWQVVFVIVGFETKSSLYLNVKNSQQFEKFDDF